jgi:hypothetical protein
MSGDKQKQPLFQSTPATTNPIAPKIAANSQKKTEPSITKRMPLSMVWYLSEVAALEEPPGRGITGFVGITARNEIGGTC